MSRYRGKTGLLVRRDLTGVLLERRDAGLSKVSTNIKGESGAFCTLERKATQPGKARK